MQQELGKLLLNSKQDINYIRNQIENIYTDNNGDTGIIYKKLVSQVDNFEKNIEKKIDQLLGNILQDNNQTIQKLPKINNNNNVEQNIQEKLKFSQISNKSLNKQTSKQDQENVNKHQLNQLKLTPLSKIMYKKQVNKPKKSKIDETKFIPNNMDRILPKDKNVMELESYNVLTTRPVIQYEHKEQYKKVQINESIRDSTQLIYDPKIFQTTQSNNNEQQSIIKQVQSHRTQSKNKQTKFQLLQIEQQEERQQQQQQQQQEQKGNIKDYMEVVDEYSSHEFMIRKGVVLKDTPEYQSYNRIYIKDWNQIVRVVNQLCELLQKFEISLANIDGKKVKQYSQLNRRLKITELFDCILNKDQMGKLIKHHPRLMFINDKNKAAARIQSLFKMIIIRKDYGRIKILIKKVKVIQKQARLYLNYKDTRRQISYRNSQMFKDFMQRQQEFADNYKHMRQGKRFEVHINSLNYDELKRLSLESFSQIQNVQMLRVLNLLDHNVSVIVVVPYDLCSEIMDYYYKLLELGKMINVRDRLYFIWPEYYNKFSQQMSLARQLIYSSKTMKRIKKLVGDRNGMIVPGYPNNEDNVLLSHYLEMGVMMGNANRHLQMMTKSGAKKIFQELDIPVSPGVTEIYDEKELMNSLALLIQNNSHVDRWLLKIDNEGGGRGIAYLDVQSWRQMITIIESNNDIAQIKQLLSNALPKKLVIQNTLLYPNYHSYIKYFQRQGGIIEAAPSVPLNLIQSPSLSFRIDPDGVITSLGSYQKIPISTYTNFSSISPQTALPKLNHNELINLIANKLYSKQMFGYFSVDLISFPDLTNNNTNSHYNKNSNQSKNHDEPHPLFWAIGLDTYYNNYQIGLNYTQMINNLQQKDSNQQTNPQNRFVLYIPYFHNQGLNNLSFKTFFHICRVEKISFDLQTLKGVSFHLIDSLQSGLLGIFTIGQTYQEIIYFLKDTFDFLSIQTNLNSVKNIQYQRSDQMKMSDIMMKIRMLYKNIQKKEIKRK